MNKILVLALALAGAVSMSACQTPQQQTGTLAGGAIGAGTGAYRIGCFRRQRWRRDCWRRHRRGHWRADRQCRHGAAQALRAVGLGRQRQPRLRRLLLIESALPASWPSVLP